MSYFKFIKNILLHPIAFLDEYFVGERTPEEYRQKTWFLIFKLWVYLFFTLTLISVLVKSLALGPLAFVNLFIIVVYTSIQYTIYRFFQWLYYTSSQWAQLGLTKEKAKNLFFYVTLYAYITGLVAHFIQLLLSLLTPPRPYLFVKPLYYLALLLYIIYMSYKIANKITDISLLRYLLYFIVLPLSMTIVFVIGIAIIAFFLGPLFISQGVSFVADNA